ncbi:MAG: DNA repair and recombination protein RadA [Candidatus Poseidoniales archaeon]|jgi:DNA repair protein RadA|uniref:DNA repair and recombination protein RadA n=1 Tax=uncultured Poseidoniia archaeon TaxID=1697135 RepID=A0A1B1T8T1_9ARCH|nr:DNA repair and recombination protein (radA) [uncultured Candidatus Thalassoarchaea sp.]MAS18120.1 DNA repair and recombination protein RadA [Euryarchaeota archaeon]MAV19685.1 DNA repair and recombination protein RadA [Euryarchaeota archaeon]RCH72948.1 MAG: DNA repair and recombination protein RadA [Candidatus Poseidoniales archaeon]|tara:strand:- start:7366 stop:8367 length:1002 start_codon:yes stop_codon:yes gene_type:complete
MVKKTASENIDEDEITIDIDEPEMTIEDLPGVGPATAEKLREAGFEELLAIAVMSPMELAEQAELGEAVSSKIIQAAKKLANIGGFISGNALLDRRKTVQKLTSGTSAMDELLGGGFETQSICEVFGEFGSGKTQIGHQLAVNTILPISQGGLNGEVFYIDTEDTFRPERIAQMAEAVGMDPQDALDRIHVARAYNSAHQMLLVDEIKRMAKSIDVKLVIVDSLTSHFRAEYVGRGMLASRQQKLNKHLKELKQLSDVQNALILVTNQVMSNPAALWGDPTKAIGGHIVGHASTFRLYLRKSKGGRRIARLIDSPNLPEGEAVFTVTAEGLKD